MILYRDMYLPDATLGNLIGNGLWLRTLELPWRDNQSNISCIPEGDYDCAYLARSASGKYRRVWHLTRVHGRSGVLVHAGNTVDHTRGCILVGLRRGWIQGRPAVLNSRSALDALRSTFGTEGFSLSVVQTMEAAA